MWGKDATSPKDLRNVVHENVLHEYNWDGRNSKKQLNNLLLFSCYLYGKCKSLHEILKSINLTLLIFPNANITLLLYYFQSQRNFQKRITRK